MCCLLIKRKKFENLVGGRQRSSSSSRILSHLSNSKNSLGSSQFCVIVVKKVNSTLRDWSCD